MDDTLKKLTINSKKEDILETFNKWLDESEIYHNEMLKAQKLSYEYYIGNQTDKNEVPPYLSNTIENRIFESVETLVPIATSSAHQFQVLPASEEPDSKFKADKLGKILNRKYETLNIQEKLENITRDMLLRRFGVLKYEWNFDKDDVDVRKIDPRLILIPKLRVKPEKLSYVIEIQEYSKQEIEDYFPKINVDDLNKKSRQVDTGETENDEYQVFEVWTDEMMFWISSDKVLDKKVNPYFDFKGKEKKIWKNKKWKKELKFYNHLDEPEKPFIFFSAFNISDGSVASTSLVEIGIPIQDAINSQKRSIINNLKQMGNSKTLVDSDALTEEEADNITNEPGLVLRGKNLASENKIRFESGTPIPQAHFANLQHSESVFDNIMGIHSSTRGAAQAATLGQDIISRQQDYTRIDTITRELNRGVSRLANGLTQLMKMFYDETHTIKMLGEQSATEFVKLNQEDIENYIEIIVKSGMNLPMDEVSLRTEAVQLWQLGALAPITLFKRLKFENPEKETTALLAWKQGQLDMETQAAIQQQGAKEGQGNKEEGRQTEGILDVLQRAKQSLGGTVKGTPKTANNKR